MSILDRLDHWADVRGATSAFIFLKGDREERVSFSTLQERALQIAGSIQKQTKGEQQRVLLFFPPGIEFIAAFLGCLYAGAIAVPIPPPQSKRQIARVTPVVENSDPTLILTVKGMGEGFNLPKLYIEEALNSPRPERTPIKGDQIAFLQYTSGSTSRPKGVILTHAHLLHHQKVLQEAFQHTEESKIVGWLPFYHDMGLIGNILQPLYLGVSCTLIAPLTFMQHPIRWLEAISLYKGTTSGGPNFAYQLCTSKISDQDLSKLDLSSWTLAFNGAERVQTETMRAFARKFVSCGFREEAFYPCYGMAETTLFITGRKGARSIPFTTPEGFLTDVVNCGSPTLLERAARHESDPSESFCRKVHPDQANSLSICGQKLATCYQSGESPSFQEGILQTVVVVDPETKQICQELQYGEIWVTGKSVAAGYWNQPEETEKTFNAFTSEGKGPFLRTGDLGFLKNGELFVLGRLKNMIILRGKNYFPHDLETCASKTQPAAAFSIDTQDGEELIIVQEIDRHIKDPQIVQELFQNIKRALFEEFEIAPHALVFVVPNSLPRTTSGKIQYFAVRQQFLEKTLSTLFSWQKGEIDKRDQGLICKPVVQKLSQILGISSSEIAVDDPIIKLGIDSLTGVQVLNWIQEEYGKELDLPYLLNGATVSQIEKLVQNKPQTNLQREEMVSTEFPLSSNQENIWVFCKLHPKSTAYNISFAIRIKGVLNPGLLKEAIADLMERHSPLRTHFESRSSGPVQVVSSRVPIPLDICTISEDCLFDLSVAPYLFRGYSSRAG